MLTLTVPIKPDGSRYPFHFSRQQSCRLILDFISTQHFMDVFMSLIRMVIYQQSVFSQHNILQTSVTHIQRANKGKKRNFSWECCDRAPGHSPMGAVLHHAIRSFTVTDTYPGTNVAADPYCRIYLRSYVLKDTDNLLQFILSFKALPFLFKLQNISDI